MESRYNLIHEKWIPIIGKKMVGIKDIFSVNDKKTLSDKNPLEKISIFKLLLAIGQSALNPEKSDLAFSSNEEFQKKVDSFGKTVVKYLEDHEEEFFLYGDRPFLQYTCLKGGYQRPYSCSMVETASGCNAVTFETQHPHSLSDDEKARYLISETCFALKTSTAFKILDKDKKNFPGDGKKKKGPISSGLGKRGYTHAFFQTDSLLETVFLNLFPREVIENFNGFGHVCRPPWERLPNKNEEYGSEYQASYIGRLLPLSRMILLDDEKVNYEIGFEDLSEKIGVPCFDPTVPVKMDKTELKPLFVDIRKKPWRELSSLLAFGKAGGYVCDQLCKIAPKMSLAGKPFSVWLGGLSVSTLTGGEQGVKTSDDYLFSSIQLPEDSFCGETGIFVDSLTDFMGFLENKKKVLDGCVNGYYRKMRSTKKGFFAGTAEQEFWELCEQLFPRIIKVSDSNDEDAKKRLKGTVSDIVLKLYEKNCPKATAKQLEAWAENFPGKESRKK